MRLVDADWLQERLAREPVENRTYLRANEIVVEAPTAYGMDKVVEKLQAELSLADNEKQRSARENLLQFDMAKGYANGILAALEIVKSGGIE